LFIFYKGASLIVRRDEKTPGAVEGKREKIKKRKNMCTRKKDK
jgi:hypothetical protein